MPHPSSLPDQPLPKGAFEQLALLKAENERLRCRMQDLEASGDLNRQSHRAALNLMQDAVDSRRRAEKLNVELRGEIADRQRAEAALRTSEGRNRIALEAAEMASWDYDVKAHRITWNDQHYQLFGLDPDEKTESPDYFLQFVHSEDRVEVTEGLRRAVEETGVYGAEFRIVRADGAVRWMSGFGRAVEKFAGRADRFMGVMFDVTARREAEESLEESRERLRLIVENAREYAIFSMDLERRITSWNPGAERLLGHSEEEALGQPGDIIFTSEDRARGSCELEVSTALAEGRASDERWHVRKDGSRFWGSGAMMAMHDARGAAIGLVKIFRDHSDQLRAKEELERSREEIWEALQEMERARNEAEAAGRAKDHFLGIVSHELRTPLTPVPLIVDALRRRGDLPEAVRRSLEKIRRSVDEETRLIDDLVDLTRITHGKLEIASQSVNVHDALHRAIEVTADEVEQKKIVFTEELRARRQEATGDLFRLQQVFWNLLRNACKFTPAGGAVTVKSWNETGRLVVEVTDTGYGIDAGALPGIFEPFSQGGLAITREFGGLGIGLAIAQAVVKAHHGLLEAKSEGRGCGATFIVTLPLPETGLEGKDD